MPDLQLENERRGFWLRMARERAHLSQATAAKELGLSGRSKSTLSAWEQGSREPRPSMLSRMAILYRVPVEAFMNPAPTAYESLDVLVRSPDGSVVAIEIKPPGHAARETVEEMVTRAAASGVEEGVRRARTPKTPAQSPSPQSQKRPPRGTGAGRARPTGQ